MISAWAQRNLLDANLRFTQPGNRVFCRVRNELPAIDSAMQLGFKWAATGVGGFTDVEICPPASVQQQRSSNKALNNAQMNVIPIVFLISHTWVMERMTAMSVTDPYQVFRSPYVIGIVMDTRLYAIDSVNPESVGNGFVSWEVTCHAQEPEVIV